MMRDPVCGLEVDPSEAPAKETFEGRTYFFCTENCRRKFVEAPERYIGASSRPGEGSGGNGGQS